MPCSFRSPRATLTPVRQLLTGIFKPTSVKLGKRNRDIAQQDGPTSTTTAQNQRLLKPLPKSRSRFALQINDGDTVVITTLEDIPLCCPDEIRTMSRQQLVSVATILNKRLPHALAINIGRQKSDNEIRNGIEFVLGLSKTAPRAPRRAGLRSQSLDFQRVPQSPQSPLAARSRRSMGSPYISRSPGLESLDEAEEDMDIDCGIPIKRRRTSSNEIRRSPLSRLSYQRRQSDKIPVTISDHIFKAAATNLAQSTILTNSTHPTNLRARKPLCPINTQNLPARRAAASTPNLSRKSPSNNNSRRFACTPKNLTIRTENSIPNDYGALCPVPTVSYVSPTSARKHFIEGPRADLPIGFQLSSQNLAAKRKCRRFSLRRRTEDLRQSVEDMRLQNDY